MDIVRGQQMPDPRDYVRIVTRHRVIVGVTVAVAVGLALVVSMLQSSVYEGSVQLLIERTSPQISSIQTVQDPTRNVDSETAILLSNEVRDSASRSLGHQVDVTAISVPTSDIVTIVARNGSASGAARDANGYAKAYVDLRRRQTVDFIVQAGQEIRTQIADIDKTASDPATTPLAITTAVQQRREALQQELDQLQLAGTIAQLGAARVLTTAAVPTSPVQPRPLRSAGIALGLGLLLGIGLAFGREYIDDLVRTREDLENAGDGLPVIGVIPTVAEWRDPSVPYIVAAEAPNSQAAEAYRTMRTSLAFLAANRELRVIQVTSPQAGDGKSTTIANLAIAFANAGRRVVVVCCDLRRPRVHEFFGLGNEIGFTTFFLRDISLAEAVHAVPGDPYLSVLSAGPPAPNPSELLSTERAFEILIALRQSYDLVLLDSPPVLPVGDSLVISRMADATLLVVNTASSSRRGLRRAIDMLRQVDAPLLGSVLNNAESTDPYERYDYAPTAHRP